VPLDLATLVAPEHTALVLQEVQNGVVGEPSALPQLAAAAAAVDLVGHCAQLAAAARAAGVVVFHCTAEMRADGIGVNRNARLFAGVAKSAVKQSPGTTAVQVPEAIGVDPRDVLLPRHHGVGPMTDTQLDSMLRNCGVTTIVGVGVSLNIGMFNLVLDAVNRGYQMVLPRDAVAGVPAEYGQAVLDNSLALLATITTTAAVLDVWRGVARTPR
jgi:nicotinamidase-related amidase